MNAIALDENLIIRMADGDRNALTELYKQTSAAVYGIALSLLKTKHDAEDVMHDTYIRAFTAAITYKPMGRPLSWLMTIVRNLCYSRIRAGRVCEDIAQYDNLAGAESDDTVARIMLETALSILDADERQIVILHAMTGLKHREIAEIIDAPTGTVLSRYNRALKKMRKELERKGYGDDR